MSYLHIERAAEKSTVLFLCPFSVKSTDGLADRLISTQKVKGTILMVQRDSGNHFLCAVGIFAGSVIFSLCGIIVGTKIESLNQYIIWTIPFEIVGFVPVIVYRIGFLWNERIMLLHPGCSVMQLIVGNRERAFFRLSVFVRGW